MRGAARRRGKLAGWLPFEGLKLTEYVAAEGLQALLFHQRVFRGGEGLHDCVSLGIELANVLAKGQGIAPEQGHNAYESVRTELVGLGFHKRLAFRSFNVAKVLVEPKDNPRATDFLGDCVESVGGVREHVAAADDGMYVGGLAGIPQHGERFVLDHVGEQVRKRIGARIDDKIAVLSQQRLHQRVEPLGIDDSGLIGQRNMAHGECRVMRESRIFLVGVEAAHRARLIDHVLRQQRADERFADAAFGLQDKMNCVLHEILISKDRECRAD